MDKEIMKVTLFHHFSMVYQGETVLFDEIGTKQLTTLLEILFLNHGTPVSKAKLIEYLWQDSDNPANLLKFSIFRLRKLLSEIPCFKDIELVLTTKEGYLLNPDIDITVDVQSVDQLWTIVKDQQVTQLEAMIAAEKIVDFYQGKLFLDSSDQFWMMQLQDKYHYIYQTCITKICEAKLFDGEYQRVTEIAKSATLIDVFFEDAYYYYIQALIALRQFKEALQLYKNVQNHFYQSVAQPLSLKMKSLYKIIIASNEQKEIDIKSLKKQLESSLNKKGAFYCEYEFFKHIYQVELRNIKRGRKNQYLIVFKIHTDLDNEPLQFMMSKLVKIIENNVRLGDVYTRINKTQVVLLLPCEDIENGYFVIHRVTQQFYRKVSKKQAKLFYHIEGLVSNQTSMDGEVIPG